MWFKSTITIFQTLIATASCFVNTAIPRYHETPKITITRTHPLIDLPPLLHATQSPALAPPSTIQLALELDTINDELKRTLGKQIVLEISSLLPQVDTIGHDILHANNQFVVNVLANDQMSHEFKKDIILLSIKLAQYGDNLGSFFLQQYYNIVDYII